MAVTETKLSKLGINVLTKAQYEALASKNVDDLYLITDTDLTSLAFSETASGSKIFKSTHEVPNEHIHVLFELETSGAHYGCDFDLHPYNSSECIVASRMIIGGTYVDVNAYISSDFKVTVDVSKGSLSGTYTAVGNYVQY